MDVPEAPTSAPETLAWSLGLLTYEVDMGWPPKETEAPLTKLVPFTVKVKPAPSPRPFVGLKLPSVGIGFCMVREAGLEAPPPGPGERTVGAATRPAVSC